MTVAEAVTLTGAGAGATVLVALTRPLMGGFEETNAGFGALTPAGLFASVLALRVTPACFFLSSLEDEEEEDDDLEEDLPCRLE